ncbi:LysR family transcriptional regulator [Lacibacterium aquatile]|uniref:LysR family transcriptional regulator n=1 Tax=Lacibacterium aquatile TaxID=1168082 RepID=A0ABW5DUF1_9PROT
MMQIRHLEVFHAVMLTGTITAAAGLLKISQPAATRLLLRAEDQLGYRLFERRRGRLFPTIEGRILHVESERVISSIDNLRKLSDSLGAAPSGRIRIAAAPALCIDLLPQAIARFRKKHPNVHFEIETRQYADLVRVAMNQEVDLAIGFDVQANPGLDRTTLTRAAFYGIFPHSLGKDLPDVVNLDIFERFPLIGLKTDNPLGSTTGMALKLAGLSLQPIVAVKTNLIALALVSDGAGAAIIDQYTAASLDPSKVVIRRLNPELGLDVHVIRARHQATSVVARRFLGLLTQTEQEISESLRLLLDPTVEPSESMH